METDRDAEKLPLIEQIDKLQGLLRKQIDTLEQLRRALALESLCPLFSSSGLPIRSCWHDIGSGYHSYVFVVRCAGQTKEFKPLDIPPCLWHGLPDHVQRHFILRRKKMEQTRCNSSS